MSLDEYRRKRHFSQTPEPQGSQPAAGGNRFVVQKHRARRLHYDFRLELEGVLKSWAVPKGPCLDPKEKRLAVQVEDHPVEYGDFEGVIPAGEYGAGTVLLWDRGTWQAKSDAARALAKGRLSFTLLGEKLRGGWTLVRTAGRGGEKAEQWLLVKRNDEAARRLVDYDVLVQEPRSVLTGRTLDQIAAGPQRVSTRQGKQQLTGGEAVDWSSRASGLTDAREAALPRHVAPALAQLAATAPEDPRWLHEIKFDGYRLLGRREGSQVALLTRGGHDWTARFPELAAELLRLPARTLLLDAELVALRPDGVSGFQELQAALAERRAGELLYQAFDLLYLDGYDLRRVALEERKRLLAELLASFPAERIRYTDHIEGSGPAFFAQACQLGLEGIISKRGDAAYPSGRQSSWLKVKCIQSDDFLIGGFTRSTASPGGIGALLLGRQDSAARLVYVGRVGTGFSEPVGLELRGRLDGLRRDACPFDPPPKQPRKPAVHWVEPGLVARVKYTGWTEDGLLRHASFMGLREDLVPDELQQDGGAAERPQERTVSKAAAHALLTPERLAEYENVLTQVRLSTPERVLYPEQGVTKFDLAAYYVQVAPWMLPHLVDRPVSLLRCPQGRGQECFFQRHAREGTPKSLARVLIAEKRKKEPYLVVRDLAGLLGLVQMGVLEIHPWGARTDRIEYPDRVIFDLDPDPAVPWAQVVEAAGQVRELLADLGLVSFLKTTGGKGLHLVVPLERRKSWQEIKPFARAVAQRLAVDFPGRFTTTISKAARQGKILVDYLRNDRGSTAVAPFSTRARTGAPVSAPLAWEELSPALRSDHFTVLNLPARLAASASDVWSGFFEVRQSVTQRMLKKLG